MSDMDRGTTKKQERAHQMMIFRRAKCRWDFEKWAQEGTRPLIYPLMMCAGGEYVSPYTQALWKAFEAGWEAKR